MGSGESYLTGAPVLHSEQDAVFLQQSDHVSGLCGVEGGGLELVAELNKIISSWAFGSASRAFSLLSCSVSFLISSVSLSICFVLSLLCSISLSGCFIRLKLSDGTQRSKYWCHYDIAWIALAGLFHGALARQLRGRGIAGGWVGLHPRGIGWGKGVFWCAYEPNEFWTLDVVR
jgi:hypothetical protein